MANFNFANKIFKKKSHALSNLCIRQFNKFERMIYHLSNNYNPNNWQHKDSLYDAHAETYSTQNWEF